MVVVAAEVAVAVAATTTTIEYARVAPVCD